MSGIKNTHMDGSLELERNLNIGGNSEIAGTMHVHKNLRIDGWLDAKNIKGPSKGLFRKREELEKAYPLPHKGWWALVGTELPASIYVADGGGWVDTGGKGGDPNIDFSFYESQFDGLSERMDCAESDIADASTLASQANITAGVAQTTSEYAIKNANDAKVEAAEAAAKASRAYNLATNSAVKADAATDTANASLAKANEAIAKSEALSKSFANTMILPFASVTSEINDYMSGNGIWYLREDGGAGHFVVGQNEWGYTDRDYNSTSNGGTKYPNPGRVWVDGGGRLYISKGMGIVPMLTATDFEFDPDTAVLTINIDERWL